MCYNTKNGLKMEPLGLQKLMQTHFNNFGDFKVIFVTEDEVYRDFDGSVEAVKQAIAIDELRIDPEPSRRTSQATV
jgi:hypothetical protein